ncbi:unnamed protein product [Cladocopium goreaui]|uniref:Bromo domain-containing protein n=1 Tax=Cladocopium goreaui TaxID=2562237 RepID=A0A9P1C5C8_9DINO|nr:unnamed protein product [Cladocopium goreaui]
MAVKNGPDFLTIRDAAFRRAKKMIAESSLASLAMRYKPRNQTTVFFAAARKPGADREAKCLCEILVQKGIRVNHTDVMNQTALFYAARQGHAETIKFLLSKNLIVSACPWRAAWGATAAAKALLDGGASLEVANNAGNTCMSVAPAAVFPALQEERTKRRLYHDDSGPGPKRRRTAMEGLRAWANEWPAKEPIPRSKQVNYKEEDIIDKNDSYAVLRTCPAECAAQLRICEKKIVPQNFSRRCAAVRTARVQARLKPGTVLTGTSEAAPIRSVVLRAVARGRKIVGRWWCCNLSEVVLRKQWNERRPLY